MRKVPETGRSGPIWCHHHGSKVKFMRFLAGPKLMMGSNAASVVVREIFNKEGGIRWEIEWEINFGVLNGSVKGSVLMTTEELQRAFGIKETEADQQSEWLISKYGGDDAKQGKFIRWKDYLNIPGPGTGNDGDPNVSIHVDKTIQKAVKKLIIDAG